MAYEKQTWSNLPDRTTPITAERLSHMETQYDEAASDIDAVDRALSSRIDLKAETTYVNDLFDSVVGGLESTPRASIRHVEKPNFNYEVIRVSGGSNSIRKVSPLKTDPDGTILRADMQGPRDLALDLGLPCVVNANAAASVPGSEGLRMRSNGLNIQNGQALQDFGVVSTAQGSDLEALNLMRDGSLVAARKSDNKTAQEYVDEGAVDSFGFGPILVENGLSTNWWQGSEFSGFVGYDSARTILGQDANGDFIIILVEGKSHSYGIDAPQMTQVALDEGCEIAVNLDGGGTTQGAWMGETFHPSSDIGYVRTFLTGIGVNATPTNIYDSGIIPIPVSQEVIKEGSPGEPMYVRQVSSRVTLGVMAKKDTGNWSAGGWVQLNPQGIPDRYAALDWAAARGILYDYQGQPIGISFTGNGVVNARLRGSSGSFQLVNGTLVYDSKSSML